MNDAPVQRTPDGWRLDVRNSSVLSCCFDNRVVVTTYRHPAVRWSFTFECPFTLDAPDIGPLLVVPEGHANIASALPLIGLEVREATASEEGRLHLAFGDGTRIDALADDRFEAWQVSGPAGALLVAVPGGGVGVWRDAQNE